MIWPLPDCLRMAQLAPRVEFAILRVRSPPRVRSSVGRHGCGVVCVRSCSRLSGLTSRGASEIAGGAEAIKLAAGESAGVSLLRSFEAVFQWSGSSSGCKLIAIGRLDRCQ